MRSTGFPVVSLRLVALSTGFSVVDGSRRFSWTRWPAHLPTISPDCCGSVSGDDASERHGNCDCTEDSEENREGLFGPGADGADGVRPAPRSSRRGPNMNFETANVESAVRKIRRLAYPDPPAPTRSPQAPSAHHPTTIQFSAEFPRCPQCKHSSLSSVLAVRAVQAAVRKNSPCQQSTTHHTMHNQTNAHERISYSHPD